MTNLSHEQNTYQVSVGHAEVTVVCGGKKEAIRLARMKLGLEMPRLYDVIHRIEDSLFRVDPAHGAAE